jgi:hypothetical protein
MNPRIMAKRPETNMTRRRMMSSSVIGIEAHELHRFWRLPPRFMARKHGESGPAIAAPNRGGNVDPKCLILSPFLRLPLRSSMRWAGFLTGRI